MSEQGIPEGPHTAVQLKIGAQIVVKGEARDIANELNDADAEGKKFVRLEGMNGDHIFFPVEDVAVGSTARFERQSDIVVPEKQVFLPGMPGGPPMQGGR